MNKLTVDDLISQVRSQIDEENEETIDDKIDILPALNRGQKYGVDILSRHYPDPYLAEETVDLIGGTQEYALPEKIYADKLLKVEIKINNYYHEVQRISYRDATNFESPGRVNRPAYYSIVGRKMKLYPAPSGTYDARIWYVKQPEELVEGQGRINSVNSGSNYVVLDSAGADLTTESDNLDSYVNVIDGQSGIVKGTFQVQNISGNKVTFKSSPSRSTVDNRAVEGDLSALASGETVQADDYLCIHQGSSVLYFQEPLGNFLIQYAVAEMNRKLGTPNAAQEESIIKKFEDQVEHTWAAREQSLRVKKRSSSWGRPGKRWWTPES